MTRSAAATFSIVTREGKTAPQVQPPPCERSRDQSKGEATRERILAIAEASVLAKGFGATSIEEIIAEAGITKSGFFYHFPDKNELARSLLRRAAAEDERVFDHVFGRGQELSDDPLQAFLIGLKLLAELAADLPGGHPGCMIASVSYQERLFDREVRELGRGWMEGWRARFLGYLRAAAAIHPPREPVPLEDLADMLTTVMEGGIILGKVLREPGALTRQILTYRAMIKMLFSPA
jgi:TetR/AcrR family transcriptional regulator, transcriptional repressor for nem operon